MSPVIAQADTVLSRGQKAIAIVSAMGRPVASQLVKHFGDEDRERMLRMASGLPTVPPDQLERVIEEFERAFVAGSGATDNLANIEAVLEQRLDEARAARDAPVETLDFWAGLAERPVERLRDLVTEEDRAVAVVVLLNLPNGLAAEVLEAVEAEARPALIAAAAKARPPHPAVMAEVEAYLAETLDGPDDDAGAQRLTPILNELERELTDAMLDSADIEPETRETIRAGLFTFEDIARLPDADRTAILDDVPGEDLAKALAGVAEAMAEAFLGAISPRARRMVEAQMAGPPPARPAVREARRAVAGRALDLIREGRIEPPGPPRA